jgi:very-short-patch-repair endonuclease
MIFVMDGTDELDQLERDQVLAGYAQRHNGLFTFAVAEAAGFSSATIRRRLVRGTWSEPCPGVFAAAVMPLGRGVRERAAALWLGDLMCLSHQSAAVRWGIPVPDDDRAWITVPARLRVPDGLGGIEVLRSRHFPPCFEHDDGLRSTYPARTIVDLAQVLDRRALTEAAEHAVRRRLCTVEQIDETAAALRGRAGLALLRKVVTELRPEFESHLEEVLDGGLRAAAVAGFRPQFEIRAVNGDVVARCDFADPLARLDVETDGFAYHASRVQQQADDRRDRRLLRMGWHTVRFTTDDVLRNLDATVREIIAIRTALLRRTG